MILKCDVDNEESEKVRGRGRERFGRGGDDDFIRDGFHFIEHENKHVKEQNCSLAAPLPYTARGCMRTTRYVG